MRNVVSMIFRLFVNRMRTWHGNFILHINISHNKHHGAKYIYIYNFVEQFITEWYSEEPLWNCRIVEYKNRIEKSKAILRIGDKLQLSGNDFYFPIASINIDIFYARLDFSHLEEELKNKIKNLRNLVPRASYLFDIGKAASEHNVDENLQRKKVPTKVEKKKRKIWVEMALFLNTQIFERCGTAKNNNVFPGMCVCIYHVFI